MLGMADLMTQRVKRVLLEIAGWGFLVLGVVGLFLPLMQGMLFIVIGLLILSSEYVWAHRLLSKARDRFPKVVGLAERARERAGYWLRRTMGYQEVQ